MEQAFKQLCPGLLCVLHAVRILVNNLRISSGCSVQLHRHVLQRNNGENIQPCCEQIRCQGTTAARYPAGCEQGRSSGRPNACVTPCLFKAADAAMPAPVSQASERVRSRSKEVDVRRTGPETSRLAKAIRKVATAMCSAGCVIQFESPSAEIESHHPGARRSQPTTRDAGGG